jgi:CHAT domain-containing protein
VLGGRALIDDEATAATIRRLAGTCRYLHVATHGSFNEEHPAFHALLLAPDDGDGALCAWEVAQLELSAVRLVTLSACDTAQLAITEGDNVDGLPLAFLAAGARAVLGTLSQVETGTSKFFFERFYKEIHSGVGFRDAFRAARDATRESRADGEDWATFYLLGDWR